MMMGGHTLSIKNIDTQTVGSHCREILPEVCSRKPKSDNSGSARLEWGEAVDCGPQCWPTIRIIWEAFTPHCYSGPTPRDSDLIGLEWGPDFSILKHSPGNSNVQLE